MPGAAATPCSTKEILKKGSEGAFTSVWYQEVRFGLRCRAHGPCAARRSPLSPGGRGGRWNENKWFSHHLFRLTASHFSCFAKKSNQKKATPTIGLILRCSEKSGTKKTRCAQTVFRSDRFFLPLLGANQRGPVEPIFDRFAIGTTRTYVFRSQRRQQRYSAV